MRQLRRGSWATKREAAAELDAVLRRGDLNVIEDPELTMAEFLAGWLGDQERKLKPTTLRDQRRYVERDVVPSAGAVALQRVRHDHVCRLVEDMRAAGRGKTAIRRCVGTLSSALLAARRQHRITLNPSQDTMLPKVTKAVLAPWSAEQAVQFLDHVADDPMGPIFEVMIGAADALFEGVAGCAGCGAARRWPCAGATSIWTPGRWPCCAR